jgi:hypothetical protein
MRIKDIIKNINWIRLALGLTVGAVGGYAYYYYVGCQSGTCPIQSDPVIMTIYGAGMGAVLFFGNKKDKNPKDEL